MLIATQSNNLKSVLADNQKELTIIITWDSSIELFLDIYIFSLNFDKTVNHKLDLVYFDNLKSDAVELFNNSAKEQIIKIDISKIKDDYTEIVIGASIYKASEKKVHMSNLNNISIEFKENESEIVSYKFESNKTGLNDSMQIASVIKRSSKWYLNPIGKEHIGGLKKFCNMYKLDL